MTLPFSGKISMRMIRDEFLDDTFDNTLNEYGGGTTPFVKNSKTQRKFSDYYGKAYAIVKSTGNNPSTVTKNGNTFAMESFFSTAEKQAQNDKILYIDQTYNKAPYGFESYPDQAANGVVSFNLAGFSTQGTVTIINNANIFAPGGVALLDTVTDRRIINGGHAIEIKGASTSHDVTFVNNGAVYAGGGGGSQGGDGGYGRWISIYTGLLEQSSGNFKPGKPGGNGAGYVNSSLTGYRRVAQSGTPASTSDYQNIGNGTTGEGRGGKGGDGGSHGQPGAAGDLGLDGQLLGSSELGDISITVTIARGGRGGHGGDTNDYYGDHLGISGGDSQAVLTIDGSETTVVAPGGGGGRTQPYDLVYDGWPQRYTPVSTDHPRIKLYKRTTDTNDFYAYSGTGGGPSPGSQGGGAGGHAGCDVYFTGNGKTNGSGDDGSYEIVTTFRPELKKMQDYLVQYAPPSLKLVDVSNYNTNLVPGGSTDRPRHGSSATYFGASGAGAGQYGGDGGNGLGGGGGGGASVRTGYENVFFFNKAAADNHRKITTKSKISLYDVFSIEFLAIAGGKTSNGPDWAEPPDIGEELQLQYSPDGSSWYDLITVPHNTPYTYWKRYSITIDDNLRNISDQNQGVYLRLAQKTYTVSTGDVFGVTPPTLYNNSNGQPSELFSGGFIENIADYDGVTIGFVSGPGTTYASCPPLRYTGGAGGDGWVLVVFTDTSGNEYGHFDYTVGYNKVIPIPEVPINQIQLYLCGAGGGGAGASNGSGQNGGGGNGGYINTFIKTAPAAVAVDNKAETATLPGGAAGRAVYFEGTKPTNWTYTDNGETLGDYN